MSRQPSDATLLRQARSKIRALEYELKIMIRERNDFLSRANRAEAERNQWQDRFDILLERGMGPTVGKNAGGEAK